MQKKSIFANLLIFADSKSRAQELSNDVSFVIFGHQTLDLKGGGQIAPPPRISWFSSTPAGIGLNKSNELSLKRCYMMIIKLFYALLCLLLPSYSGK